MLKQLLILCPGNVGHAGSGTGPENAPHYQDHEDDHTHHVGMKTYYLIFTLLMVLLFLTVGAWYFDQHVRSLGAFSTPIAMAIAVAKAVAIVLFFMHVKFSSRLVQIFACTGVAFVSIMFLLTFNDYGTREWLPRPGQYNTLSSPTIGDDGPVNKEQIRVDSVGASPNDQSTPSDNIDVSDTAPKVPIDTARGNVTREDAVLGANLNVAPPTTSTNGSPNITTSTTTSTNGQSSSMSAPQAASGSTAPTTNGSAANPGPILGGAANNSFGSTAQSAGIEPSRNTTKPAPTTVR